jgi:hypothetical protein
MEKLGRLAESACDSEGELIIGIRKPPMKRMAT